MIKKKLTRPGKIEGDKVQNGKDLRDLNQVGKRIKWCRNQLNLSTIRVSRETGVPVSSYCGRENGARAIYHEEYYVLANYFNNLWQEKFKNAFPWYEGERIYKIKVCWVLFGILEE
jgi:transcriptional regulator with XRE-family HTH domain